MIPVEGIEVLLQDELRAGLRPQGSAGEGEVRKNMADHSRVFYEGSLLTGHDIFLFKQGNHFNLHDKLGSHVMSVNGVEGTHFAVWAPNAERVSVVGDFNWWNTESHFLRVRDDASGIWEGFVPGLGQGTIYKYHIVSRNDGYRVNKGDPYAFHWETPPKTGSIVWDTGYEWRDGEWMSGRSRANALDAPMSIYEVHLGSWRRVVEDGNRSLSYREMADYLPAYVKDAGFTHVELLPIMEHPFYGSWGYQTAGYFAPTSRFGTPQDLMYLIDRLHEHGIGVILDWVPSHFPGDEHGLVYFDGTNLYEHTDPRKGFQPGMEELHLQPRPLGSTVVSHQQRSFLGRTLPRGRHSGRRGRLHALPRLRPQGRRMDSQ